MSKFTPGPWTSDNSVYTSIGSKGKHIAMVNYYDCGEGHPMTIAKEEHDANVNLIKASPDLYSALVVMTAIAQMDGWAKSLTGRQIAFRDAVNAINKANKEFV